MRRIYSHTLLVFVWLGDSDSNVAKGIDLAKYLSETTNKVVTIVQAEVDREKDRGNFAVHWNHIYSEDSVKHLQALDEGPADDDIAWAAFYDIFCKPWFRRTWILQEVVTPRLSRCWAFCGDNDATISLSDLQNAARGLGLVEMMLQAVGPGRVNNAHWIRRPDLQGRAATGMYSLVQMNGIEESNEQVKQVLLIMLDRFRYCGCSDPRDRIYGLLGIDPQGSLYPPPDYSLSVEKVFYLFAWYMVGGGQGVEVLCRAGRSRQRLNLPSWCPDWTTPLQFNIRNLGSKLEYTAFDTWPDFTHLVTAYTPAISMDQFLLQWNVGRVHLDQTKRIAYVYGCMFDSIAYLGPIPQVIDEERGIEWHDRSNWLLQCFELLQRSGCAGNDLARYKALTRLLMFTTALRNVPEPTTKQFQAAFGVPPDGPLEGLAAHYDLEYGTLQEAISNNPALNAREARLSHDFQLVVSQVIRDRRLCVTQKGYIGLVPAMTEAGDTLYQFQDAVTPSIIRQAPKPTQYVLIGEAYMLDLMDGIPLKMKQFVPGYIMIV